MSLRRFAERCLSAKVIGIQSVSYQTQLIIVGYISEKCYMKRSDFIADALFKL